VFSVQPSSPAADAGMLKGDVIVNFDGVNASSSRDIMQHFKAKRPGEEINLLLKRKGHHLRLKIAVASPDV